MFENMISRLIFLLFFGNISLLFGNAQKLPRAKRQSLKVQINVTGDAVCMRYIRPSPSTKLQGFILGYGSSFFSNQYISLPSDGKSYITELDAEPRYLISVRPAPATNYKKPCSGKTHNSKPLQLVIGTLTPTSVFLSWGILVNPKHDWTTLNNCANDRFYTVRYREKDKNKKWVLQLCPTTETVVDNLKPNTIYEFGVKDNTDNGIWSKIFSHKVAVPSKNKENGELQNSYKFPKVQTQFIPGDSKVLHPVTIIKQVLQNATHRKQSKIPEKSPLAGPILVHLIVPDFNGTQKKLPSSLTLDVPERPKKILVKNETQEWPAESKTPELQEISPHSQHASTELDWKSSKPTSASVSEESDSFTAHTESELESSKPSITPLAELPYDTLAPLEFPEFSKTKMPPSLQILTEKLASIETQPIPTQPQTAAPKSTWTKPAVTNEPTLDSLTPKSLKPLDWPRTTLAPVETLLIPFKRKPSATPEGWQVKPATNLPTSKQTTSVTSRINEQLNISPAPVETLYDPSTPKSSARLKITETKYEKEPQWETITSKIYKTTEFPRTTLAPKPKPHIVSPKTTVTPQVLHTKPVLKPTALRTEPPKLEIEERRPVSSRPKTWFTPDVPQTKPDMEVVTFRTEQLKPTIAPKETRRVTIRPKTSPSSGVKPTKHSSKGNRRIVSKPKTSPSPKIFPTKPAVIPFSQESFTATMPHAPEKAKATLASTVKQFIPSTSKPSTRPRMVETKPVHGTTSQPLIIKPTLSSEQIKTTMVPKETWLIPSKPKTSGKLDVSQTKPAPSATYPGSINLHIHVFNDPKDSLVSSKPHNGVTTTEGPHLENALPKVYGTTLKPKTTDRSSAKLVVNKTTPAPPRTRTQGGLTWGKLPRGDKLTDQDATKLLSTSSSISSNTSLHSSVARKKTDPVATPPGSPRPPLAPARPTQMRRKPLPPNTVTGKPGRSGNVLMPRASSFSTASSIANPTGPTSLSKTRSPKKPPTAASSPDYSSPMFSSLPTTETDIAGTPRYTGDHVKYMQKEDDVPCSITDTLQYFPTEEGESTDTATSPPRKPPTNLTVVTVEGCPSFVILDWEKPQNETVTEYKVVSTENGGTTGKDTSIITTNQTHSTVENLKPNTSYEFVVIPSNPLGEGPSSESKPFKTESADPRVTEPISMGKDAIWTQIKFNSDTYSECKGKQFVKRTWYKKFVGVQLCNSLRYKIYLSDSLTGTFYNIGDQRGHGEDHCQFVDSYLDGRTGQQLPSDQLPTKDGFFRAVRQEPVNFGRIGAGTHINYVHWYECGTTIPGKW
uniref:Target of Nesh-SH3 isoform X14 n=1 Tax=Pogona vitticeps TaxID=103695 RepID=A0ABM5FX41_9SAUR